MLGVYNALRKTALSLANQIDDKLKMYMFLSSIVIFIIAIKKVSK